MIVTQGEGTQGQASAIRLPLKSTEAHCFFRKPMTKLSQACWGRPDLQRQSTTGGDHVE